MNSPDPPATPDPNVVSAAQTKSNQDTSAYNNAITHGNTTTPYGSQTYTGRVDPVTGATVYDQNVTVDPAVQATINAQNNQDLALANTGTKMLGQVDSSFSSPLEEPMSLDKLSPTTGGPGMLSTVDLSNLPQLYGSNDLLGARQQVQDALYNQQASYLDPQYAQKKAQLNTELANKGITEGSQPWQTLMDNYNRAQSQDYSTARNSAITGGGDEMTRLAGIALANRGQVYGEDMGAANFQNAADSTKFAQNLQSTGFNNDVSNQALTRALALRNQPLNELNALRSAGQVSVPQFASAQNSLVSPTNTSANDWNAYNANQANYQQQANASSGVLSGLFGLGGSVLGGPAGGVGATLLSKMFGG